MAEEIFIEGAPGGFDAAVTFGCGQAFRFTCDGETARGVALGRVVSVRSAGAGAVVECRDARRMADDFRRYLSLDTDYGAIFARISTDPVMEEAVRGSSGLRVLRQDPWECLVSFIISQNNNIPRIKNIIAALCAMCGDGLGGGDFAFPDPGQILARTGDLGLLRMGYREEYVIGAAKAVLEGSFSLEALSAMDDDAARRALMGLKGVGGKVADCVMLFGLSRTGACPHDVWVERIWRESYGLERGDEREGYPFARARWGDLAGIAQQCLYNTRTVRRVSVNGSGGCAG